MQSIMMMIFLLFSCFNGLSVKYIVFSPSETVRTIEFYYSKQINKPINLGINEEQYNTKNTLLPQTSYMKFQLSANKSYNISLVATEDQYLDYIYIFAAYIFDDKNSQFFYFLGDWLLSDYTSYQRPQFHLSAPRMWINDPNGLIFINGEYHIFYQYNPFSINWGNMYWGHSVSSDGVNWRTLPIALTPGPKIINSETIGGAFSGGAWEYNGQILLYYTDSIETKEDFIEIQNYTISEDFIHFQKPVTAISERPIGVSKDFRDPVIFQNGNTYLQLLGTSVDGIPSIIKYKSSSPLGPWQYDGILYQNKLNATTIECPNIAKPIQSDKIVLFFSVNDYNIKSSVTLYLIGELDDQNNFSTQMDPMRMDWGGHFYAAQSYGDILISWMQDWQKDKKYLGNDQFSGIFTLMRRITIENDRLYQRVIEGAYNLIKQKYVIASESKINELSYLKFKYSDQTWKITIKYIDTEISIQLIQNQAILIIDENGNLQEYKSNDHLDIGEQNEVEIWLDRAAIEIFVNSGEAVFAQRFIYTHSDCSLIYTSEHLLDLQISDLKSIY